MSERHRFRFFVEEPGAAGARAALAPGDVRHVRVLRLEAGTEVEVVDGRGELWSATLVGDRVAFVEARHGALEPPIELVAGALVGGRFDELVDASVQAGASRVIPLALHARDAERLAARRARLQRIARAAAKQSKRRAVPDVAAPIGPDELRALEPGIVVDAAAAEPLDRAVGAVAPGATVRLLVGPAAGLERDLVEQLQERGWQLGRLGSSILRAELAAPVAVAIAAMHAPRR